MSNGLGDVPGAVAPAAGPAAKIRSTVTRALDRFRPPRAAAAPVDGAKRTPDRNSVFSQSSAPPLDLSYLWSQEGDRLATYRDADLMDAESDLTNAALNAWATTATAGSLIAPDQPDGAANPDNKSSGSAGISTGFGLPLQAGGGLLEVRVTSADGGAPHPAAQQVADQVFTDCNLARRAWTIARDTRKYGDKFMEIVVDEKLRVRRLKSLPPAEIVREEDEYGRLAPVAFHQIRNGVMVARFAAWQIVHLRNNRQGDEKYGRSGVRTARRIWRMLNMLQDSLVSARLSRGYQKLVHFLPVSDGATQQERADMVQDYMRFMTKTPAIDPLTGSITERENPVSVTTDYFLTISPSDSPKTGIQSLDPANAQLSHIPDLEYFQNLLVSGLEVPKAYLGLERDVNSKATLIYQEIHFLRMAGSLQNTLTTGIKEVLDLAFTLAGIDPAEVDLSFRFGQS